MYRLRKSATLTRLYGPMNLELDDYPPYFDLKLHFLRHLYMKLYLSEGALNVVRWWVYASYGNQWECRSNTKAVMSMGKGAILIFSGK